MSASSPERTILLDPIGGWLEVSTQASESKRARPLLGEHGYDIDDRQVASNGGQGGREFGREAPYGTPTDRNPPPPIPADVPEPEAGGPDQNFAVAPT